MSRDATIEVGMGMAVIPPRLSNLELSVPVLLDQCDRLFVHINGMCPVPSFLKAPRIILTQSAENQGDAVKLAGLRESKGYFFTVDDDILYPDDYVARMIRTMRATGDRGICCVHGHVFNPFLPVSGFALRQVIFHFTEALGACRRVMIPGTGTCCLKVSVFRMFQEDCRQRNMADFWTACKAVANGVPIYCVPRAGGWLKQLPERGTAITVANPVATIEQLVETHSALFRDTYASILSAEAGGATGGRRTLSPPPATDTQADTMLPPVSVVVRYVNRPRGLQCALKSLLEQDYRRFETIVLNFSEADIAPLLDAFQAVMPIQCLAAPRGAGLARAMNAAFHVAKGVWVAGLDDHSVCFPQHLSTLVTLAQINPACGAVYTCARRVELRQSGSGRYEIADLSRKIGANWDPGNRPATRGAPIVCRMHRRATALEIGGYDARAHPVEDGDFLARLARAGGLAFFDRITADCLMYPDDAEALGEAPSDHEIEERRRARYARGAS